MPGGSVSPSATPMTGLKAFRISLSFKGHTPPPCNINYLVTWLLSAAGGNQRVLCGDRTLWSLSRAVPALGAQSEDTGVRAEGGEVAPRPG